MAATYSPAALIAAHTDFLGKLDAGTGPGKVVIYDASDVTLVTVTLTDPAGTVNGTTGQLTLTQAGVGTAVADGTASYAEFMDSDDTVHLTVDVFGTDTGTAQSGFITLNNRAIITSAEVSILSAVIG